MFDMEFDMEVALDTYTVVSKNIYIFCKISRFFAYLSIFRQELTYFQINITKEQKKVWGWLSVLLYLKDGFPPSEMVGEFVCKQLIWASFLLFRGEIICQT